MEWATDSGSRRKSRWAARVWAAMLLGPANWSEATELAPTRRPGYGAVTGGVLRVCGGAMRSGAIHGSTGVASSISMIGISSRIAYRSPSVWQIRHASASRYSRGPLHLGQTRMARSWGARGMIRWAGGVGSEGAAESAEW